MLVLFTACFHHFLNSSMTSFLSEILLPFPNLNDLNSHAACQTLSKALDISSATARVDSNLLKALAILSDTT